MDYSGFKKINRRFIALLTMLLCAVSFFSFSAIALEKDSTRTIKVGYAGLQGFLYENDDGSYGGIAYEILQEIGTYNNWSYEYISSSYAQAEDMLNSGEIDIFIPYQKTEERMKTFEYSENVFCTNKASLLTLPDSEICYDDFEKMDGIKIGAVSNTRNSDRFEEYLSEKGANVTLKTDYHEQSQLIEALKSGEIDAFISASNRGISNCKIISVLSETNSYVIAKKGSREILDMVDNAIAGIEIDMPGFMSGLEEKFQTSKDGSFPSLTRNEVDYIGEKKSATVLVSSQECDKDGNFAGSAKIVFDKITAMTGMKFTPVICNNTSEITQQFRDGKADIMYSFTHDYQWAENCNCWLTSSYADFYDKLITKPGTEIKKVAVVGDSYIEFNLRNNTDLEIVECSSYKDGIDMVYSGKVDATYCNSPIGTYYSTFPKYRSLSFMTTYDFESAYCMAVSKQSNSILVNILNKSLSCFQKSMLTKAFEEQASSRQVTIEDTIYSNPRLAIATITIAIVILAIMIFLGIYIALTNKKNRQLAIANNAKTDFLSRMSHDMRTPMNGILGLAMLSKDETDLQKLKENLGQIELSGKYLLELINDTLDMNKIESGKLELHTSEIQSEDIFNNVISNAKILAEEKNVKLNLQLPKFKAGQWRSIVADASRLEQILINVISNAVKFSQSGGTVDLIMQSDIQNKIINDTFIIRDYGIGMSEDFLPHIFEAFSQEGRKNINREEGSGLGMPIVKQLTELMGGTIEIKSKLGEGTEVTIKLSFPISENRSSNGQAVYDDSIFEGRRILLCEDHPLNTKIAVKLLENKGMIPQVAENGRVGVELFDSSENGHYDLILMDMRMPELDGIGATKAIRNLQRSDAKTVPIVAMTANAFDEDVKNCLDAGMNDHLSKPVNPEIFYKVIAKYLSRDK